MNATGISLSFIFFHKASRYTAHPRKTPTQSIPCSSSSWIGRKSTAAFPNANLNYRKEILLAFLCHRVFREESRLYGKRAQVCILDGFTFAPQVSPSPVM